MSAAVPELNCGCCRCCCNFIVVNLQRSSKVLLYPKYAISLLFSLSSFQKKKKATSTFWGRGDQKAFQGKDYDPQVLPHNNTQRPKNITKMISSAQTIASVSALKVRLLSRCFAHSCTIARARCGALRLNRGKNWEVSQGQRSRGRNFCLRVSLFSPPSKRVGKTPKRAHFDGE